MATAQSSSEQQEEDELFNPGEDRTPSCVQSPAHRSSSHQIVRQTILDNDAHNHGDELAVQRGSGLGQYVQANITAPVHFGDQKIRNKMTVHKQRVGDVGRQEVHHVERQAIAHIERQEIHNVTYVTPSSADHADNAHGLGAAQPHHGDMAGPLCYDCHGPDHSFHDCLNHAKNCHGDEVCQFKYGGHTEVRCHKAHDCDREIRDSDRQCASGGYEVHGACQICCADDTCTTDIAQKITTMANTNTNNLGVHCPATCTMDNLAACVSTGHICNGHQYCKVSVDETNGNMHGRCEDVKDLHHCKDEAADGHCDPAHHNCIMGCCQDDQCVAGSLGATTTSLYEFLKGDCKDQLVGNQCSNLDSSQHLCSDRLAVRVCPQTCGLCSLFQTISCKDTVVNDGCKDLVVSEDICNKTLGKFICPATCNMCEAVLEEQINMMLQNPNPTDSTASIVPPDFGALACGDLANQGCVVLDAVCPTLNCSDVCSKCQTTVMAVATTAAPDGGLNALQCSDLAGLGCGVLDALCSKVNCPDVCDPCFNPIVTVTDMPATTVAPAVDMTTVAPAVDMTTVDMTTGSVLSSNDTMTASNSTMGVCEDTRIQDMTCSDVADVCSSPLLVWHCQKYCGLCV